MGSPGTRDAILAAQNNIEQHLQYCIEHECSEPGAIPSTVPTGIHIDNGNMYLVVQFHDRFESRGAVNTMMRLVQAHGIEELRRVGVIGQGSVAHMREMALAAGVYNIPVHSQNSSTGELDNTEPTSPLDLRRLDINTQLEPTFGDSYPSKAQPIPFPSNEDIDSVQGHGTVAFNLESELMTRGVPNTNKSRPDIVLSDVDGGIGLSGICMAFVGTGTQVFGAAPEAGFWEYAWNQHTPGATPTQDEQAYRYWAGTKHPMSDIPWSTFTAPRYLSGVFEVNHEQVNAARILARDNYNFELQSDETVPLAVALYNEEFQNLVTKRTKKGRKCVVGIILRSRKDYH